MCCRLKVLGLNITIKFVVLYATTKAIITLIDWLIEHRLHCFWAVVQIPRSEKSVSVKSETSNFGLRFLRFLPHEATPSAVLPRQVVCLSVRPSVCDVEVSWSYTLEFLANNSRLISLSISLSADPNMTDLLHREHPQIVAGIGVGKGK